MLALLGRRNHVWERIYVPASGWVVASSPGMNLCSAYSASQPCMGRFLAYSLCTSYEAKTFKMNKKNSSENYFRFWKSYAVIMKQILRKRSALLCVTISRNTADSTVARGKYFSVITSASFSFHASSCCVVHPCSLGLK